MDEDPIEPPTQQMVRVSRRQSPENSRAWRCCVEKVVKQEDLMMVAVEVVARGRE
jgi:hypothetical protein